MAGACDECGWATAGGRDGCRGRFDAFLARDFSDPAFFRSHRMFVDAYCLQHPEQFCASAKSLAAHLVGMCWVLEGGAATGVGPKRLRAWLDGDPGLEKPPLPGTRPSITIGDLPERGDADEWAQAVRGWAESAWGDYAALQPLARAWKAQAERG
jgi:hypothetical protein